MTHTGHVGVAPDYRHTSKTAHALPAHDVVLPGGRFKWYDVVRDDEVITEEDRAVARRTVLDAVESGAVPAALGFVVLHLGGGHHFLAVWTWPNENELWQTLYVRGRGDFRAVTGRGHKPVMCVWEMGPVVHEQQAWVRFLRTSRDAAAVEAYLADRASGAVGWSTVD